MSMYRLYAHDEPSAPLIQTGRTYADLGKAKARAKELRKLQVELRDDSKPRSRSLLSIFVEGIEIASYRSE